MTKILITEAHLCGTHLHKCDSDFIEISEVLSLWRLQHINHCQQKEKDEGEVTVESRRHGRIQGSMAPTFQLPELVPGHRLDISQPSLSISGFWSSEKAVEWPRVHANTVHTFSTSSDLLSSSGRQIVFPCHLWKGWPFKVMSW